MKGPTDPPPSPIPVPLKGCVLLLTAQEFTAGIKRGKWWRNRETMQRREAIAYPPPVVASSGAPDQGD
jgi:hypothetical protein